MGKKTARNVTDAEHSPIGRVQVGTYCSNLDGKGAGVATRPSLWNRVVEWYDDSDLFGFICTAMITILGFLFLIQICLGLALVSSVIQLVH